MRSPWPRRPGRERGTALPGARDSPASRPCPPRRSGSCACSSCLAGYGGRALEIAVIADTHLPRGSRRLPERCLELLARSDAIIHAGDFSSAAVLAELQELG